MITIIITIIMIITHYLQELFSWLLLFMFFIKGEPSRKEQKTATARNDWLVNTD